VVETVFFVPRLNEASVTGGACCSVPAEAVILPELELLPGVAQAEATWRTGEVRVWHGPDVRPEALAEVLAELSYPAESWHTIAAE
jgi:hypothetical protein